ncbi:MAG: O-antigen ligase family protein [Terriglobales bacterium]
MALSGFAALAGYAVVAGAAHPAGAGATMVAALYAGFALACVRHPYLFVAVDLLAVIVPPPFYIPAASATQSAIPVFAPILLLPAGMAVLLLRYPDLTLGQGGKHSPDILLRGLVVFMFALLPSIAFAFWLSGAAVGAQSLLHWLVLAQIIPVYVLARAPAPASWLRQALAPLVMGAALVAALYGIVDFIHPLNPIHPSGDEFIWLGGALLRRAQGFFYEASNFANFCTLLLLLSAAAFLARREDEIGLRAAWGLASAAVFSVAAFLSFSRNAWGGALVGVVIFVWLARPVRWSGMWALTGVLALPLVLTWVLSPGLWGYFLHRRISSLGLLLSDPYAATSGRVATWEHLRTILLSRPGLLVFGVGYKTLGITRLFHTPITTDNGYLSLLAETGCAGLLGYAVLSISVLRQARRLLGQAQARFWGAFLAAAWGAELVEMLAVDAQTYWRGLLVLLTLAAWAQSRAEAAARQRPDDPRGRPPC